MNARDAIRHTHGISDRLINAYLADLSDADLLVRPIAGQNHIAWQLGHLIAGERRFCEGIKPGSSPDLPAGFEENHGRDEAAIASDDPAKFLTKDQYLSLWKTQRECTNRLLDSLSDAELDLPGPERSRRVAETVGECFMVIGWHPIMHCGQWVSVRRKLGKPIAI